MQGYGRVAFPCDVQLSVDLSLLPLHLCLEERKEHRQFKSINKDK